MSDKEILNADNVVIWQQEQWTLGNRLSVADIVTQLSWLTDSPETILDLIYSEVLLREDLGDLVEESEYTLAFPDLAQQISRQFQVHRALINATDTESEKATAELGNTLSAKAGDDASQSLPTERNQLQHPEKIAGFSILGIAGRGGNGIAYRAFDTRLKRIVAIKLLDVSRSTDVDASKQLMREAEASAALTHRFIVQVFQVGESSGTPFLVMEYVDGGSLAELLQSGPLPVPEAVEVCLHVADAIRYAHGKGVIHRDLKPGNILLDVKRQPRVCDFGLARRLDAADTMHVTGNVMGTPAYMSPEQARGEKVDERADVYALGAVLYEALSGRPPYQAATPWEILHQVLTNDVVPLTRLNASIPRDLETICERCLEKDRNQRYLSADEVFLELERFRTGRPILARPLGRIPRLVKWIRRHPAASTMIVVVTTSLLAVSVVSLISQRKISDALVETQDALLLAEQQRDVAVQAMNDLVYKVHDDLEKREASVEARGEVLQSAIEGLQQIMEEAGDAEDTRITLATALTRYGYILTQQGRNEDAEAVYLKSIEVAETLESDAGLLQKAQNYSNIALFYVRAANFQAVDDWANRTLQMAEKLLEKLPDSFDLKNIVVQANTQRATAAGILKDLPTALAIRKQSQQLCRQLVEEHPEEIKIANQLIDVNLQLIQDCITVGELKAAREYVNQSRELLETQHPGETEDVQVQRRYSSLLRFDGVLKFAEADYDSAINSLQTAIEVYSRLATVEPNRPGFHLRLGTMHDVMADCQLAIGNLEEAELQAHRQIEETENGIKAGGSTYDIQRYAVMQGWLMVGSIQFRKNLLSESAESFRTAARELEPVIDQYNTRDIQSQITQMAEILAALAGQEHQADETEVEAIRKSDAAWRGLLQDDDSVFLAAEEQLYADIQSAERPFVKSMLTSNLALCYALQYSLLKHKDGADIGSLNEAEAKCTEALKAFLAGPDPDPQFHVRYPEFRELRSNARFMQTFAPK